MSASTSAGGAGGNGGAAGAGGGLWSDGGLVLATNDTIVSNSAADGGRGGDAGGAGTPTPPGGAGASGASGGGIDVTGAAAFQSTASTVVDNSVGSRGASGLDGNGALTGPAITAAIDLGGGIAVSPPAGATLTSTLLADNFQGNCAGTIADGGHNLSFNGLGCPATFGAGDPKLGPLLANGGPTKTIGLGTGSAAIDQVPVGNACPATDERGVKRPSGPACDIGAYEVTPPSVQTSAVTVTGQHSVRIHVLATAQTATARVWIQYGKTAPSGYGTVEQTVSGLVPASLSFNLTHLNPKATYHFQAVVTSSDGTTKTADAGLALPELASARISGAASGKPVISYTDTHASRVQFSLQRRESGVFVGGSCVAKGHGRHGAPCAWVTVRRFTHRDRTGANRFRLPGKRLLGGRYRLEGTPNIDGVRGQTLTVVFHG